MRVLSFQSSLFMLLMQVIELHGFAQLTPHLNPSSSKLHRGHPRPFGIPSLGSSPSSVNMDVQGNILVNNRHSASDWFYNVKSIPQSGVLKEILGPVKAVASWALLVSVVQRFLLHSSSSIMKTFATKLCIPGTAHSFLVSALGLLLVFRTNASYQRFYVSYLL